MLRFILYFLALHVTSTLACEISLSEKVLIINDKKILGLKNNESCSSVQLEKITKSLSNFNGRNRSEMIASTLQTEGIVVNISKGITNFIQISKLISEKIQRYDLLKFEIQNFETLHSLSDSDEIIFDCLNCNSLKNITAFLVVLKKSGEEIKLPLNMEFEDHIKAYKIKKNIPAFSTNFEISIFEEIMVPSNTNLEFFTDLNKLHFFKTNKQLNSGDFLKLTDLTPINLVKAGRKTEIILENSLVKIKLFGLSKSNGGIGETVEIYQKDKNRIYVGTVLDENKVLVKL